jgi:deazaflavin-dependent oxidoreductase (nitroreductase family)
MFVLASPSFALTHSLGLWQNTYVTNEKEHETQVRFDKPHVFWWQRFIQRIASMRWPSRLLTRRLHRWDRWVHRLSKGRYTATAILTGLPVVFITTIGAKSGLARTTPLLAIRDGDGYLLIATKFGADHHPDWYLNIRATPRVEVLYKGKISSYKARLLEGEERKQCWDRAVAYYPGYQAYEQRAGSRQIPVLKLTPIAR